MVSTPVPGSEPDRQKAGRSPLSISRVAPARLTGRELMHALLLIAALVLLQFPQFIPGSSAILLFAGIYGLSWLAWPMRLAIFGPFAAFMGLAAASALWSEHPKGALVEATSTGIVIMAGLAVGAALSLDAILRTINRATVVIGAVSLFLGFALPHYGLHSGPAYAGTLVGLYISKNALAAVIIFGALAVLFREWPKGGGGLRIAGSYLIYIPVFVKTESVTTIAILAAGLLIRVLYEWWRRSSSQLRIAAGALMLIPVLIIVALSWSIYTGALALLGRDATLTGRTNIWAAATDAWLTKPWLGVGWGSFESDSTVSYFQYLHYGWVRSHAHSGYFQILAELGILGAAMLLVLLVVILVSIVRTLKRRPTKANGWLLAAFFTFIAHNVAEQSMRLLPMFILALVFAACVRQRPQSALEIKGQRKKKYFASLRSS